MTTIASERKNVRHEFDPQMATAPKAAEYAATAARLLDSVSRNTRMPATAKWRPVDDVRRPGVLFEAEVSDFTGAATADFTNDDVTQRILFEWKVYDLWDNLLRRRSDYFLERLEASAAGGGGA